jgi:hypothetical protein
MYLTAKSYGSISFSSREFSLQEGQALEPDLAAPLVEE